MTGHRLLPLFAALAVACGGPTKVGKKPSWRSGGGGGGAEESTAPQRVVFAPSGRAVERYNDGAVPAPSGDPLAEMVVAAIRDAAVQAGMEAPEPDGRLYAAAHDLASVVPEDGRLKYPAVEFALQRHGIIEPSPNLMVIWGPIGDPAAIMEQLATRIPEIIQAGPFSRIGFASVPRGEDGEGAAILALQVSYIETEPIPRTLPGGGGFDLRGRIKPPFEKPEVYVTREKGDVEQLEITSQPDGSFRVRFECGDRSGRQQFEITAVDATGSTVLANFPIWCRLPPPTSITLEYDPADDDVVSPEAAEQRMVELINRDRAQYQLPPVQIDPRVAEVARAHSREMYETGVVAHISPRTGSASDRVRAAGISTPVVLENVARAYGVGEAEEGLMNSPGHRANILSREASHVGVGIVVGEEVAGRRELFITQVFTYQTPSLDAGDVVDRLNALIKSSSGVIEDQGMSELAQIQAREVASGVSREVATRRTAMRARSLTSRYSRVATAVVAIPRVESFEPAQIFRDKSITHYGIGAAQGAHDEMGDNAIHVVILLGVQR